MSQEPFAFPFVMLTVKEMARIAKVCGGTIYNAMKAYDQAVAQGVEPPRGALRYTNFGGHRLAQDIWFAEALGVSFGDLRAIEARVHEGPPSPGTPEIFPGVKHHPRSNGKFKKINREPDHHATSGDVATKGKANAVQRKNRKPGPASTGTGL
jgi:hypothetical protein